MTEGRLAPEEVRTRTFSRVVRGYKRREVRRLLERAATDLARLRNGLGATLPTGWISLAAGLAFLAFGAWTLRGDHLTDDEKTKAERSTGSAVLAVGGAFFLAELGDKTMLATITLATQHGWFGTWLGSTLGMVAADALAIMVGRLLGKRLPEKAIKYGAAALFAIFGTWLIIEAIGQLR